MKQTRTQDMNKKPSFAFQVHRYNEQPPVIAGATGSDFRRSTTVFMHLITPTFLFPERHVKPLV